MERSLLDEALKMPPNERIEFANNGQHRLRRR